jgi:hypothetical protein
MAYFTKGVNDGDLTKGRDLLQYIISMPICHTHTHFTTTDIVDYIIYSWLKINE